MEYINFEENLALLVEALQVSASQAEYSQNDPTQNTEIHRLICLFHSGDLSRVVESVPPKYRLDLCQYLSNEQIGHLLNELSEEVQTELIAQISKEQLIEIAKSLDLDDLADIIPILPESTLHHVLLTMDIHRREHLAQVLSYPADSAGGLMNTDVITVRADVSVNTVMRYLRLLKKMPTDTDQIFVVDSHYKLLGSIHLSVLVTQSPKGGIKDLINPNNNAIKAVMPETEVAHLFAARDLISAPVVDNNNQLIGRITIDDVVDVIKTQAEHSVMSMAGLDEEDDLFAPVFESANRRIIWLFVNLITAFVAVFAIGLFEATLEEKIALAILMPVVASMGGIAGTQTLILFTRGLATNKISRANVRWLFNKELGIGAINGFIWSLFIGGIVYLWFWDLHLSLVIAFAVAINLIFAAVSGALLPLILTRLKIDPALAGGVILTTITDVVGFVVFLGLASIFI